MLEMMLSKKKASGGNYPSFGIFTHGITSAGGAWATASKFAMTDHTWSAGAATMEARGAQGWTSAPTKGYIAGNGAGTLSTTEKYDYGADTVAYGKNLTTSYYSVGSGNSQTGWFSGGNGTQVAISKYNYGPDTTANSGNLGSAQDSNATGGGNASFGVIYNNAINKINYSTDTVGQTTGVTAIQKSAHIGTTSYGLYVNGGNFGLSAYYQTATKFIYATDVRSTQTGIALNKQGHAGANDSVQGLIASGWNATGYLISCDTYQFATNTVEPTTNVAARRNGSGLSTNPGWY